MTGAHAQVVQARADAMPQVRLGMTYQRTFASPLRSSTGSTLPPFAPDTTLPVDQRVKYLGAMVQAWVAGWNGAPEEAPGDRGTGVSVPEPHGVPAD